MEEKRYLLNLLAQFPNVKESKIQYSKIPVDALSFVKLCRLLSETDVFLKQTKPHTRSLLRSRHRPPA